MNRTIGYMYQDQIFDSRKAMMDIFDWTSKQIQSLIRRKLIILITDEMFQKMQKLYEEN